MQSSFFSLGHCEYLEIGQEPPLQLIYSDKDLIVVNKPAGQLFHGYTKGVPSPLVDQLKAYIQTEKNSEGNVYLGVVHRLDRPVSGAAVFARNSRMAEKLGLMFQQRNVEKIYLAVVEGHLDDEAGILEDYLLPPPSTDRPNREVEQYCQLKYESLARTHELSLLAIRLGTGRRHQIRRQLALRACTIAGDAEYGSRHAAFAGSDPRFAGIALHAAALLFHHPKSRIPITAVAGLPHYWQNLPLVQYAQEYLHTIQGNLHVRS